MSGEATVQVLDTSVDATGLSIISATKTVDNPRLGAMYNPLTLAAALPVWFHPINDGTYLAVLRGHWEAATIGTGGPQSYSAHTEVAEPTWVIVDPVTGATSRQDVIPTRLSGTRLLTDACSYLAYLYTVGTIDAVPFIQYHRVTANGTVVLQAEEIIVDTVIGAHTVSWHCGLYIDGDYLVLMGVDGTGALYRRRKSWARVGVNQVNDPWQYKGAKGWFVDPTEADAETTASGTLTGGTVVSYAKIRDREWLCTNDGTTARFYSSRMVEPNWKASAYTVTADVVYLQPQLRANLPALPDGVTTAIPWVSTKRDSTTNRNALQVSWGALPV